MGVRTIFGITVRIEIGTGVRLTSEYAPRSQRQFCYVMCPEKSGHRIPFYRSFRSESSPPRRADGILGSIVKLGCPGGFVSSDCLSILKSPSRLQISSDSSGTKCVA
jgi:hypothetical protein